MLSTNVIATSSIPHPVENSDNERMFPEECLVTKEYNIVTPTYESPLVGSTWVIVSSASEESITTLVTSIEEHPSLSSRNIFQESLSRLELSCFFSMIHERYASSS